MLSSGGSQGPSLRCLGAGEPRRRRRHREHGERPKRSGGPRRGENLQRSGREEAGLPGRGNSCPAEVGGGACGIQRPKRHAGTGLPKPRGGAHSASARCTSPVDRQRGTESWAQPSRLRRVASFGRHSTATTLGPSGRCRCGRHCRSWRNGPMAQIGDAREFPRARRGLADVTHARHALCSARQGTTRPWLPWRPRAVSPPLPPEAQDRGCAIGEPATRHREREDACDSAAGV